MRKISHFGWSPTTIYESYNCLSSILDLPAGLQGFLASNACFETCNPDKSPTTIYMKHAKNIKPQGIYDKGYPNCTI